MTYRIFARLITLIIAAILLLSFLGWLHPAFDTLANFRGHLAVLLGLAAILILLIGFRKVAVLALALAGAALSSISSSFPLFGPHKVQAAFGQHDETSAMYRLLQMNLRFDNQAPEKVLSLIERTQPDVVTLDETSTMWIAQLERLSAAYPHRIICPGKGQTGGVAILSRRPFETDLPAKCHVGGSLAIASVNFGGQTVRVAAVHLGWPWPFDQWAQVDQLGEALGTLTGSAILAGDFNATGWTVSAQRVAEAGGLTPVPSIGVSWLLLELPKALRPWIGLPIDHVMIKGNVSVHSALGQDDAGSDHLPVLVEFSLLTGVPAS